MTQPAQQGNFISRRNKSCFSRTGC